MSRLLVFQHVAAEPLGTLDALIRQRGHRMRFVNFERDPDAQPSTDRYRGLIVLGGPMNVEDREHRQHLLTEMRAIESMLAQGKPVLGICLGAQLLAHVLGAHVVPHEMPEIGWHSLSLTDAGREDPILSHHADGAPVFQWHRYRFDVPEGAVVVPGARAVTVGAGREWGLSLATPVIVKYRDERTDARTELERWIR